MESVSILMQEIEVQKKRMNLVALSSMQDYLKQLISLSLLQQNLTKNTKVLAQAPSVLKDLSGTSTPTIHDRRGLSSQTSKDSGISEELIKKEEGLERASRSGSESNLLSQEQKVTDTQIKMEEEDHEEDSSRRSDSASPNSIETEDHGKELSPSNQNSHPLFDLFPRKKKELVCSHSWRKHHAKGLCKRCYEKHGRTKKPWNCDHQVHFARGLCRKCYFKSFKKNARYDNEIFNELKARLFKVKRRY